MQARYNAAFTVERNLDPGLDAGALLERHRETLRRFVQLHAATVVRRKESLSDLVQTVFRELLHVLHRTHFTSETQFRNWLFVTARNKLRNRLKHYLRARRDVRREVQLERDEPMTDVWTDAWHTLVTPARIAVGVEEMARVESCLRKLPAVQREAILLSRMGGLSAAEIGAIIGRGEGATRALLSRALARLSMLLEPGDDAC